MVLFDELGMPKTRRTKSGYTTDAEALQALYDKTEHPFLAHLLVHRDAIRLRQVGALLVVPLRGSGQDRRLLRRGLVQASRTAVRRRLSWLSTPLPYFQAKTGCS